MTGRRETRSPKPEEITEYYAPGFEARRLQRGVGRLDRERTRELLRRYLPPAPALLLDLGGGPGAHACWLAGQGYEVHLLDLSPLHVRLALEASERQPEAPLAGARVGDARELPWEEGTADAVLLFGPLYHLTDPGDRQRALLEARRVLKPGGVLLAMGISRFASLCDGLRSGNLKDPRFAEIVRQDLANGQHRNPIGKPEYFMATFFHHPEELRAEVLEAGFALSGLFGVEGPGWLLPDFNDWWETSDNRALLLEMARTLESEPALQGVSAHLIAVATRK
jgi:SAM-dependent methyltransferase